MATAMATATATATGTGMADGAVAGDPPRPTPAPRAAAPRTTPTPAPRPRVPLVAGLQCVEEHAGVGRAAVDADADGDDGAQCSVWSVGDCDGGGYGGAERASDGGGSDSGDDGGSGGGRDGGRCGGGGGGEGGALALLLALIPRALSPAPPADERQLRAACGDVLALCDGARVAFDEALACLPPRTRPPPPLRSQDSRSTVASSVSDDVFADDDPASLASSAATIFDDGVSVPVPPPRRNKMRRNLNSSSSVQSASEDCSSPGTGDATDADLRASDSAWPGAAASQDDTAPQLVPAPEDLTSLPDPEVALATSDYPDPRIVSSTPGVPTPEIDPALHIGPSADSLRVPDPSRERKARSVCADFGSSLRPAALSASCRDLTSAEHALFRSPTQADDDRDGSDSSLLEVNVPTAKPVSSFEFPASADCLKPPSPAGTVRSVPSSEDLSAMCDSALLGRPRKGSGSSDIAAWKRDLARSVFFSQDDDCMQADEWFSSTDGKGRVYYFEENSSVSSWTLPNIVVANEEEAATENDQQSDVRNVSLRSQDGEKKSRVLKTRSMFHDQRHKETSSKSSSIPRNWLQIYGLDEAVLKHGNMNRTKITENGKKMSKKWASAYVVLTDDALCFYKDLKNSHHSVGLQPELSMQLSGARVESGEKLSSRKHVFLVTSGSLQLLCECESAELAIQWRQAIGNAIAKLNLPCLTPPIKTPPDKRKVVSIGRSKSLQVKNRDISSIDDAASNEEQQMKIRDRLKKFFNRRPTREILASKGIYKDEPVFDSRLEKVCPSQPPYIPDFVKRCINVIESKEENMKTDGLYRASGNLSHVQKIRLQVDQNNLSVLEAEEDVHVLTGALKLFFRELKEPLIPYDLFNKAIDAGGMNGSKKEKIKIFREIVKQLPRPNHDTLQFLLKHLRNVTAYQEFNRMQIPNLAIVFGPTLMWREKEFNHNIAIEYMQQNLVIEFFLQQFDDVFR